MFVRRFYLDLVFFSFFFSVLFCILCRLTNKLLRFWVFLELCGLSIVPCFFYVREGRMYGFYNGLLTYIVMSRMSSVVLVSGLLFSELYYFVYFGFVMKVGLFPFRFWIYHAICRSKWFFIFLLSVVLKFPLLFFCFLYQMNELGLVIGDALFTILGCCFLFWVVRRDWKYIWCHISLASVSTLIVICFCADVKLCFFVYFYYFIWSVFSLWLFSYLGNPSVRVMGFWLYCFLLLVTPLSLPLFYKLSVCVGLFYSSLYLLLIWRLYKFSEQFFLYKLGRDYFYSMVFKVWV